MPTATADASASTSSSWSAASRRRARGPRRSCSRARSAWARATRRGATGRRATWSHVDAPVEVAERPRSGSAAAAHKLVAALDAFGIEPAGRVASTSARRPAASRTCCCSAARRRVYALDVGTGSSPRSSGARPARRLDGARQRPDARPPTTLPEPVDLAVVDVSFISLGLVLGPIASVLRDGARADRRPGQAAVRGGPGRRQGRRRARPGGPPPGPARTWRAARRSASGRAGVDRRRRSRGRRATASSSSASGPGRRAPTSTR